MQKRKMLIFISIITVLLVGCGKQEQNISTGNNENVIKNSDEKPASGQIDLINYLDKSGEDALKDLGFEENDSGLYPDDYKNYFFIVEDGTVTQVHLKLFGNEKPDYLIYGLGIGDVLSDDNKLLQATLVLDRDYERADGSGKNYDFHSKNNSKYVLIASTDQDDKLIELTATIDTEGYYEENILNANDDVSEQSGQYEENENIVETEIQQDYAESDQYEVNDIGSGVDYTFWNGYYSEWYIDNDPAYITFRLYDDYYDSYEAGDIDLSYCGDDAWGTLYYAGDNVFTTILYDEDGNDLFLEFHLETGSANIPRPEIEIYDENGNYVGSCELEEQF